MSVTVRHRLILILFCAVAWLPGLSARTLWPPDEARYALIARDMIASRDYVVPIKGGEVYHSQPPLFLWAQVLASRLTGGLSETAARLPSLLAGMACVLITHAMAASLFGPVAGLMSGLVLASDVRFLLQAQWVSTDMLLCLFVTAALGCFHAGYQSRRRIWYLPMYALVGLGTLTKGPVGAVLPGLAIVCFLVAKGDVLEILRMRLPAGAVIAAAIVAPWYVLYWRQAGMDRAADLVLTQSFGRYLHAWNNEYPWHYFLGHFPVDFLPWTVVFPFALAASAKRMERAHRLFLWSWFGAMFLFFSISSAKRGVYILPLHPAAAMIVGWFWHRATMESPSEEPRAARRSLTWCALAIAALFAALGAVLLSSLPERLAGGAPGARRAAAVLAVTSLAAAASIVLAPLRARLAAIAAAVALLAAAAAVAVVPIENRRQNIVGFSSEIAARVPVGARLGLVGVRSQAFAFYSGRPAEVELPRGARLEAWLRQPGTLYAVLDRRAWEDLQHRPISWELLIRQAVAGEDHFLIVKR